MALLSNADVNRLVEELKKLTDDEVRRLLDKMREEKEEVMMDHQCDRCGQELETTTRDAGTTLEEVIHVGYHIVLGGNVELLPDGDLLNEWEPEDEYDLCRSCKNEFYAHWKEFYTDFRKI